jgi:hypothetical protein
VLLSLATGEPRYARGVKPHYKLNEKLHFPKSSSPPTPPRRKMSEPSTTPYLPPELWLQIFIHLDDPHHAFHTCRAVSREFLGYVKMYLQACFVPGCTLAVCDLKWANGIQDGVFSHYSEDGRVACFNLTDVDLAWVVKDNTTMYKEPPESLEVVPLTAWSKVDVQATSTDASLTLASDKTAESRPITGLAEVQRLPCWKVDMRQDVIELEWYPFFVNLLVRSVPGLHLPGVSRIDD